MVTNTSIKPLFPNFSFNSYSHPQISHSSTSITTSTIFSNSYSHHPYSHQQLLLISSTTTSIISSIISSIIHLLIQHIQQTTFFTNSSFKSYLHYHLILISFTLILSHLFHLQYSLQLYLFSQKQKLFVAPPSRGFTQTSSSSPPTLNYSHLQFNQNHHSILHLHPHYIFTSSLYYSHLQQYQHIHLLL